MTLASDVFGTNASQSINSRDIARSNSTQFPSNNITKSLASRRSSIFDSLKSAFSFMGNTIESLFNRERQSSQEHLQATTLQKVVIQTGESSRLLSTLFDSHSVGLNLLVLIDKKLEELLKRDQCDGKKTTLESLTDYRNAAVVSGAVKGGYDVAKWGIGALAAAGGTALGMLFGQSSAEAATTTDSPRQGSQGILSTIGGWFKPKQTSRVKPLSVNMNQKEYYNMIYNTLLRVAENEGIDNPEAIARLGAAQSSLETGWGKHIVGNNVFGIKAFGGERSVVAQTSENENGVSVPQLARFRQYDSIEESVKDYIQFLKRNPRYSRVLKSKSTSEAIEEQGKTGYATDPLYAQKLISINASMQNNDPTSRPSSQNNPAPKTTAPQTGATINRISSERMRDFVVSSNAPVNTVVYNQPTAPNVPDSINGENTDPDSQYPVSPSRATLARMYGTDLAAILGVTSAA